MACKAGWRWVYRAPSRCEPRPMDADRLRKLVRSGCKALGPDEAMRACLAGIGDCSGEPFPELCDALRGLKAAMVGLVEETRPFLQSIEWTLDVLESAGLLTDDVHRAVQALRALNSGQWSQEFDAVVGPLLCGDLPQQDPFETGGGF